jgi:hypothetical protein
MTVWRYYGVTNKVTMAMQSFLSDTEVCLIMKQLPYYQGLIWERNYKTNSYFCKHPHTGTIKLSCINTKKWDHHNQHKMAILLNSILNQKQYVTIKYWYWLPNLQLHLSIIVLSSCYYADIPRDADNIISGYFEFVETCVTQPLWPRRVPRNCKDSDIFFTTIDSTQNPNLVPRLNKSCFNFPRHSIYIAYKYRMMAPRLLRNKSSKILNYRVLLYVILRMEMNILKYCWQMNYLGYKSAKFTITF